MSREEEARSEKKKELDVGQRTKKQISNTLTF